MIGRKVAPLAALAAALLGPTGCVTVYQPLAGLQGPVVVDPEVENFPALDLFVRCVPKDLLEPEDASALCDRVRRLFENQGARVSSLATLGPPSEAEPAAEPAGPGADRLVLELRARELHSSSSGLMWALSLLTFTLAPAMSEYSFVQEVVVRDARGTPLMTAALEGRLVRYYGLGYWFGNGLLNWFFRDDDEELNDGQVERDLSRDLYGQLSQIVYNAQRRSQILNPVVTATVATSSVGVRP